MGDSGQGGGREESESTEEKAQNEYEVFALQSLCSFFNFSPDFASVYNAGDPGLIPGLGRSPGEGNGNPLQDYCLENPMDRGTW